MFAGMRTGGNSWEFFFPGWRKQSGCSQRSTLVRHSAAAWSFCFLCATTCATLHPSPMPMPRRWTTPGSGCPHSFCKARCSPATSCPGNASYHQLHACLVGDHPELPLAAQTWPKRPKSQRMQRGEQTGSSRCTPQLLHAAKVPEVLPVWEWCWQCGHHGTESAGHSEHPAGRTGLEGHTLSQPSCWQEGRAPTPASSTHPS